MMSACGCNYSFICQRHQEIAALQSENYKKENEIHELKEALLALEARVAKLELGAAGFLLGEKKK